MLDLLKQIPAAAYTAFFTAVITATVTLLGVYLTNRGNTQRLKLQLELEREIKEREFIRERLEELYILMEHWVSGLITLYLPYLSATSGKLPLNKVLEMNIENMDKSKSDFKRLQMIMDLYFPDVKPAFNRLLEERDKANKLLRAFENEYKGENAGESEYLTPFMNAYSMVGKEAELVKERIVTQAKRYNNGMHPTRDTAALM